MNSLYKTFALFCIVAPSFLFAQNEIPNPGFESWGGTDPVGWTVNNAPGFETVKQSTDAFSGSLALKAEVISVANATLSPSFWAGDVQNQAFSVTAQYNKLTGYYQYNPAGGDTVIIVITIQRADRAVMGVGTLKIFESKSSYTKLEMPITYDPDIQGSATFGSIHVVVAPPAGQLPSAGTAFLLDNLSYDGIAVSVESPNDGRIPDRFILQQNYPNPFNPETLISYQVFKSGPVELAVFNLLGQKVQTLINAVQPAGAHTARWLGRDERGDRVASGVYVYRLTSAGATLTKKMLLLQ